VSNAFFRPHVFPSQRDQFLQHYKQKKRGPHKDAALHHSSHRRGSFLGYENIVDIGLFTAVAGMGNEPLGFSPPEHALSTTWSSMNFCHMHHRDHSEAFWDEVDKVMPDYCERKAWL
jgi:hypothetical protein